MISATLFHFISSFILDTFFIRWQCINLFLTFINFQFLTSSALKYTGDFSFASGSIAVLMKECGNLAARNLSILANISSEENGPTGSNFVEEIAELLCPNDCSFNGKCVNGSCVCNKEFTADDCSASIYQIPTILT